MIERVAVLVLAVAATVWAFRNWREGLRPGDFTPHPRMMGEGDGHLDAGPLKGVRVPLPVLRDDYFTAMRWDPTSGRVSRQRAAELGLSELLGEYVA